MNETTVSESKIMAWLNDSHWPIEKALTTSARGREPLSAPRQYLDIKLQKQIGGTNV